MSVTIEAPNQPLPPSRQVTQARLTRATYNVAAFGALLAVVAAAWYAAVTVFRIPPFIMPTPAGAFAGFVANRSDIGVALLSTLRNATLGLAAALILAIALAAAFVSSKVATKAFLPLVIGLRTAPVVAIAPILILIFGRGTATAMVVVIIVAFFPIMVNAMKGFASTRRSMLEMMHVLGAGWLQTFFKVRFPYALAFIFSGLRAAATSAILSAMLAEWLSGAPGMGTLILDAASYRKTNLLWAAVVVAMLTAYFIFSLTTIVERRLLAWRG